MYYPCSENKGADQLRGYREADLCLCFRIGKYPVFSRCGSYTLSTGSNRLCLLLLVFVTFLLLFVVVVPHTLNGT